MELAKAKSKKRSKRNEEQHELPGLERVLVEDVQVISKHHREVNARKVAGVAASMAQIGLRTPITVRRIEKDLDTKILLVAGLYRLEAAKKLGWEHIDAFVMEGTKADARMWQLIENLYRADLTALQRAEHVAELVQAVLQDPEGAQLAPRGGQQPHDRGIKKAAKALGYSRDEIRRSLKIDGISEAAKTKAKELGLDDNQSALLKIAEEDGEEAQLEVLEGIKSGKTSGSNMAAPGKANSKKKKSLKPPTEDASGPDKREHDQNQEEVASPWLAPENEDSDSDWGAVEETDNLDDSTEKDRLFAELKGAWDNAPKSVRKRFIKKVLHLDLDGIGEEIWTA
jgi:ParB/RepB/Spo0J family partition protein